MKSTRYGKRRYVSGRAKIEGALGRVASLRDFTQTSLGLSLLNYNRAVYYRTFFYLRNDLEQTENGTNCRTHLFKIFSYAFN